MFVVTREMYHAEMAAAVYEHLRDFLLAARGVSDRFG